MSSVLTAGYRAGGKDADKEKEYQMKKKKRFFLGWDTQSWGNLPRWINRPERVMIMVWLRARAREPWARTVVNLSSNMPVNYKRT